VQIGDLQSAALAAGVQDCVAAAELYYGAATDKAHGASTAAWEVRYAFAGRILASCRAVSAAVLQRLLPKHNCRRTMSSSLRCSAN
jgi:hypothetical protein